MAMCESIEELIEFLRARADRCQESCQHVAAVGHRETIKHLENIVKDAKKEETYEYTAQVFMNQHWVFMWSPRTGNSLEGKWHATRKLVEKFAEQWQLDYPTRIVRRRVSPMEIVNG